MIAHKLYVHIHIYAEIVTHTKRENKNLWCKSDWYLSVFGYKYICKCVQSITVSCMLVWSSLLPFRWRMSIVCWDANAYFRKAKFFSPNFAIKFQIFRYGTNFHHLEAKRNFLADSCVKRCCPCCSYFGCNRTVHWDSTIKSFYLCLFVHLPSFYFHKVSFSSQTFIVISKARELRISHRDYF